MALSEKQAKFIASYQITQNATQSALNAGYSEKSACQIGSQLMSNPKIIAALEAWKAKKSSELTKEDFIDLAIKDYKELNVEEPNKPRFLEIAGKTLGYLGKEGENRPNQTLNITNINLNGSETKEQLLEMTRRLLEGS